MDVAQVSLVIGLFLAKVAAIGAIFYLPFTLGSRWLTVLDNRGLFTRPVPLWLTLGAGATVGLTVLYFNLGFDAFTFDAVFRVGGPWSLSFHDFLGTRVNPLEYSFEPVLDRLAPPPEKSSLGSTYLMVTAALAVVVARALWLWRSLEALKGIVCVALVAAWAGYMALFGLALFLWLANLMNFWLLLPLTYAIHLGRNAHPGAWRMSDVAFGSFGTHAGEHDPHHLEIEEEEETPKEQDGHGGHDGGHGGHGHEAGHGQGHGSGHAPSMDNVHPLSHS